MKAFNNKNPRNHPLWILGKIKKTKVREKTRKCNRKSKPDYWERNTEITKKNIKKI